MVSPDNLYVSNAVCEVLCATAHHVCWWEDCILISKVGMVAAVVVVLWEHAITLCLTGLVTKSLKTLVFGGGTARQPPASFLFPS